MWLLNPTVRGYRQRRTETDSFVRRLPPGDKAGKAMDADGESSLPTQQVIMPAMRHHVRRWINCSARSLRFHFLVKAIRSGLDDAGDTNGISCGWLGPFSPLQRLETDPLDLFATGDVQRAMEGCGVSLMVMISVRAMRDALAAAVKPVDHWRMEPNCSGPAASRVPPGFPQARLCACTIDTRQIASSSGVLQHISVAESSGADENTELA